MFLRSRTLQLCRDFTRLVLWSFACGVVASVPSLRAAEAAAKIAPQAMVILKGNCFGCHNEEKKKGGLLLTSRQHALKGGENGAVLAPGKPAQSKLLQALAADADPHMPPKKQLSDKQIAIIQAWIEAGAQWDDKALAAFGTETPYEKLGSLPANYGPALTLALSPNGDQLAVARGSAIAIYDTTATNRSPVTEMLNHRDAIQSLAWNHDGALLASGSYREVLVWNSESWKQEQRLTNEIIGRITGLVFSPDDKTLFGADGTPTRSGIVRSWETINWKPKGSWDAHRDTIMSMDISHDGKYLATGGADKLVKLWSISNYTQVAKLERHMGYVLGVSFSPDDSMLGTVSADKVLNLWDTKTKEQKITVPKHPAPLTALTWAGDGKKLFSVAEDGIARSYTDFKGHSGKEQSEGAQMRPLSGIDALLYCIAVSSDGKTVYGGADDGVVYVWNSEGKLKWKLSPPAENRKLAAVENPK